MNNPATLLLIGIGIILFFVLIFHPTNGIVIRLRRSRSASNRVIVEDILKNTHLSELASKSVNVDHLAHILGLPASRIEKHLTSMEGNELLRIRDNNLSLTPSGQEYALRIIRAHRLWEKYLADETSYNEEEWHILAEEREHTLTVDQLNELESILGRPTHDPHGDPIPTNDGVFYQEKSIPVTSLEENTPARIVHLEDEPPHVYAQLIAIGLDVGENIRVLARNAERLRIWVGGDEHVLAPIIAQNISVVPLPESQEILEAQGSPLSTVGLGQPSTILSLSPRIRGAERRRLMDLGILPGSVIKPELASAGQDPIAYRVRGALIALRNSQAELINVDIHKTEIVKRVNPTV